MENDGCRAARGLDPSRGCEEPGSDGVRGPGRDRGAHSMSSNANPSPAVPEPQESYIVTEGKKRGSTRDIRPEAAFDRYYKVLRVHAGDAILTDNWHTNEVLDHARHNFEGVT